MTPAFAGQPDRATSQPARDPVRPPRSTCRSPGHTASTIPGRRTTPRSRARWPCAATTSACVGRARRIDPDHFWSKPVLSFWLMSLSLLPFGLGAPGASGTLALSTRAEWAVRLPFCLFGVLGIYAVYLCVSRFVSRRAGVLAAVVTATSPIYALVSRQAMTDMAFVGPDDDGAGAGRAGAVRRRGRPAAAARGAHRPAPDHLAGPPAVLPGDRRSSRSSALPQLVSIRCSSSGRSTSAATRSRFRASS